MTSMTTKVLAAAALALAGSTMIGTADAEARGFRGGGFHAGFRGGFHGFRPTIRPAWGLHRHVHIHRHWGFRRHVAVGVIGIGAALPACAVVRRFDPVYGIFRRVTVCN